jgi:hypothetical protein
MKADDLAAIARLGSLTVVITPPEMKNRIGWENADRELMGATLQ